MIDRFNFILLLIYYLFKYYVYNAILILILLLPFFLLFSILSITRSTNWRYSTITLYFMPIELNDDLIFFFSSCCCFFLIFFVIFLLSSTSIFFFLYYYYYFLYFIYKILKKRLDRYRYHLPVNKTEHLHSSYHSHFPSTTCLPTQYFNVESDTPLRED